MTKVFVAAEKVDELPFHDLFSSWERFQAFCADLMRLQYNVIDSREYLKKGHAQHGIDAYSIASGESRRKVAQCKLTKSLSPGDIRKLVDEFLCGPLVSDTETFILCTSADLATPSGESVIQEVQELLSRKDVKLKVWDQRGLSAELRTGESAAVVSLFCRYLPLALAEQFFGDQWREYIQTLIPVKKRKYPSPPAHILRHWNPLLLTGAPADDKIQDIAQHVLAVPPEKRVRIVLLSAAGFGKTAEIEFLAGHFSSDDLPLYPLKLLLRDYLGQSLEALLDGYDSNWRNLPPNQWLLLFDGIDELKSNYAQTFFSQVNAFLAQYPETKIIATSRYNLYKIQHGELRDFKTYQLLPLSREDIEAYCDTQLADTKHDFLELIRIRGFEEYQVNPYYLTKLIAIFRKDSSRFPRTRRQLMEAIAFEQLKSDYAKFHLNDEKNEIIHELEKLAFCMTVSGVASLDLPDIKKIIPDESFRNAIMHLCLIMRDTSAGDVWSFGHKNVQEYLTARLLAKFGFEEVLRVISFEHDRKRIIPAMLNTVAFLFEILDRKHDLFEKLLTWLQDNHPELLVQFEKDQLSRTTRRSIFTSLFENALSKGTSLRAFNDFSLDDLASFAGVDEGLIDYLAQKIEPDVPGDILYDAFFLMSSHPSLHVVRDKIIGIFMTVLDNPAFSTSSHISILRIMHDRSLVNERVFVGILGSGIDKNNFGIRRALIRILVGSDFKHKYFSFLLSSVEVLEKNAQENTADSIYETLKTELLSFREPAAVKKLLSYLSDHLALIEQDFSRKLAFNAPEIALLMENAVNVCAVETSILPTVYRIYRKTKHLTSEPELHQHFLHFFRSTCGFPIIFRKLYKAGRDYELMFFADPDSCAFLKAEYIRGHITEDTLIKYRNLLSHFNYPLFRQWHDDLKDLEGGKFRIDDVDLDYNVLREKQHLKNQQMLLDRSLYLEEAEAILAAIPGEIISSDDFWFSHNSALRRFQYSIVYEQMRTDCRKSVNKKVARRQFVSAYSNPDKWETIVIHQTEKWLRDHIEINQELIEILAAWTRKQIAATDFDKCRIEDLPDGGFRYYHSVEFLKSVVLLLKLELDDDAYLKLLLTDHAGFYDLDNDEKSLARWLIEQIRNKALISETIRKTIKEGKCSWRIQNTLYRVAVALKYTEFLAPLYSWIKAYPDDHHDRIRLTEFYLRLGGNIHDFQSSLQLPLVVPADSPHANWHWYLLEELLHDEREKILPVLRTIISTNRPAWEKLKAARCLMQLEQIEGLVYWKEHIITFFDLPSNFRWESVEDHILNMPVQEILDIFLALLDFYYRNQPEKKPYAFRFLDSVLHKTLTTLSTRDKSSYERVQNKIMQLTQDPYLSSYKEQLLYFEEKLTTEYLGTLQHPYSLKELVAIADDARF